jgi:hypothetical protein
MWLATVIDQEENMQDVREVPNPARLLEVLELNTPLIGVYDAPDTSGFEPLVRHEKGKHVCLLRSYDNWRKGDTLHLTRENAGCGGSAYWMFGKETRTREDFANFLAVREGLKDSAELMDRWLDHEKPYQPEYPNIFVGPLKDDRFKYLKTVTFLVTPDQLSVLSIGAQYFHSPEDLLPPVIAPMGSGCGQMLALLKDLDYPQALIGSTDIAMRQYLPPAVMSFSVTVPMYRQLCQLDDRSFLYKPFLKNLKRSRGENGIGQVA